MDRSGQVRSLVQLTGAGLHTQLTGDVQSTVHQHRLTVGGQVRSGQVRSGQVTGTAARSRPPYPADRRRTEYRPPAPPDCGWTGQVRSGQVRSGQVTGTADRSRPPYPADQRRTEYRPPAPPDWVDRSGQVRSGQVMSLVQLTGQAMSLAAKVKSLVAGQHCQVAGTQFRSGL